MLNDLGIIKDWYPIVPSKVFLTYWRFAVARQEVFFNRLEKKPRPWSKDSILEEFKFTNAYRASDRVSQYLIRNVIYDGNPDEEEVFFRILLFKTFNKIDTWEYLKDKLDEISYSSYSFDVYSKLLQERMDSKKAIYSAAYIMTSGKSDFGYARKHQNHLKLLEQMMKDRIVAKITKLKTMQQLFSLLKRYPTIGDFLAYQYTIDINYSALTDFSEMEFVVPGPGAYDGIHKCFFNLGGFSETEIIHEVTKRQNEEFERQSLSFKNLWGRPLQLIDCQNLFCEISKYSRVFHPDIAGISGRTKIKQKFRENKDPLNFWYPPKWNINNFI